jgi:hypothetical protein
MPAPTLRRYSRTLATTGTETVVAAVPAARALVVGKVTATTTAAATFRLSVGGALVAADFALNPGEVYAETGLVLTAGETITASASVASVLTITVHGEEVDN